VLGKGLQSPLQRFDPARRLQGGLPGVGVGAAVVERGLGRPARPQKDAQGRWSRRLWRSPALGWRHHLSCVDARSTRPRCTGTRRDAGFVRSSVVLQPGGSVVLQPGGCRLEHELAHRQRLVEDVTEQLFASEDPCQRYLLASDNRETPLRRVGR